MREIFQKLSANSKVFLVTLLPCYIAFSTYGQSIMGHPAFLCVGAFYGYQSTVISQCSEDFCCQPFNLIVPVLAYLCSQQQNMMQNSNFSNIGNKGEIKAIIPVKTVSKYQLCSTGDTHLPPETLMSLSNSYNFCIRDKKKIRKMIKQLEKGSKQSKWNFPQRRGWSQQQVIFKKMATQWQQSERHLS